MKGLIIKDFIALKKYAKQFLLMGGMFLVFAIAVKSPEYVSFMFMLFGSMTIITSISYDENVGWNKFAFSMPLKKGEVVLAKYIVWFLITIATSLIAMLIGTILSVVFKQDINEFFVSQLAVSCIYIIMFSILIPVLLKIGVEKGRIAMLGIFLIPTFLLVFCGKAIAKINININWERIFEVGIFLLPLIVIVAVLVSYRVSVRVVQGKEW